MDKIYICYASSDYYARETGISLLGFLDNNPNYKPEEIFILDYGILPSNKEKLNSIAKKSGKTIEYIPAKQILEDIQTKLNLADFRGSLATYSRAFIDKIMPPYVNRLLYIDSDTVVVGDISELETYDMKGACMAGVISQELSNMITQGKITLYSHNKKYYGCGIVLFNLTNWRNNDCYSLIVEVLGKKRTFPMADQTLINNALNEELLCELPLKYNYKTHYYHPAVEKRELSLGGWHDVFEVSEAMNAPIVIHYAGNSMYRPWYSGCISRRASEYFYYKSLSPWKDDELREVETYHNSRLNFGNWYQCKIAQSRYFLFWRSIRMYIGVFLRKMGLLPKPSMFEGIE